MGLFKPRRKLIVNREVQYDILMYMGLFITGVFITQIFAAWMIVHKLEQKASAGEFASMTIAEFIARYKTVFLINEYGWSRQLDDAPYHEEETDRQLGKPYGTSRREWYRDDRLHDEHGRNGRQKRRTDG